MVYAKEECNKRSLTDEFLLHLLLKVQDAK